MRHSWLGSGVGFTFAFALGGLGAIASGCGSSTFACSNDSQCQSDAAGTCQANGYCSFPDEACPSGQRFGDAAPSGVADECVEPEAATDGPTTAATDGDSSQGLDSTTVDSADASATVAVDDGPTTGPDPAESSGGSVDGCNEVIIDEFDGMALDPMWGESFEPGGSVDVEGGQLWLTIPQSMPWTSTLVITELGTVAGGWARLRIDDVQDPATTQGLALSNGPCEAQIFISGQTVNAYVWDEENQSGMEIAGEDLPSLPISLQLLVDADGDVHFEYSEDETNWTSIADGSFPGCGDFGGTLTASIFLGGDFTQGASQGYQRFEACLLEP